LAPGPDWSIGEVKNLLSLSGIQSPFPGSPVRSLVTIVTELPQLPRVPKVPGLHLDQQTGNGNCSFVSDLSWRANSGAVSQIM
jgi:hypothetical protein